MPSNAPSYALPGAKKILQSAYRFHGQTLELADSGMYLGVKVTEDLSWPSRIAEVTSKLNRTIGFLRRNFKECTQVIKAASYTTMVRAMLEYCSAVLDPHWQGDIKAFDQV